MTGSLIYLTFSCVSVTLFKFINYKFCLLLEFPLKPHIKTGFRMEFMAVNILCDILESVAVTPALRVARAVQSKSKKH